LSYLALIVLAMTLSGFLLLSLVERYFLQAAEDSLLAQARITAQVLIPGATLEDVPPVPEIDQVDAIPAEEADLSPAYNAVQQQQLSNLSLQAENYARPAEEFALEHMDLTYLASASLRLSSQLETRIRILDGEGLVLVDSGQPGEDALASADPRQDLSSDPMVRVALQGEYTHHIDRAGGELSMHLALPVMTQGRLVGVVYLTQPLGDVMVVLYDLRVRWLLSTAMGLIISAVLGLVLSGAIARPVRRLTAAAEAVAQGHFGQRVPVTSRDEVGRLTRTFNDMTARLETARQVQVDFVANVSHELRTPLTSVKGMLETLRAGAVDDLEVRGRFLETAEDETDRLIRLVNDLLLLSRADSEALQLRRETVDMARLSRRAVDRLESKARDRGLCVKTETGGDTPMARIDPDRIEQVLINLLDNAIKYSRPGGTIIISVTATPDGWLLVQVRDEGIGIPAYDLPRIGQRFYRADKARSRAEGGSGLGLAIAQALVSAHGGRSWLESQEGKGTTAYFTVPAA
jgi:signal transduction histidine kinase